MLTLQLVPKIHTSGSGPTVHGAQKVVLLSMVSPTNTAEAPTLPPRLTPAVPPTAAFPVGAMVRPPQLCANTWNVPPPPATYYDMSHRRVKDHEEPIDRLKKHGILIDGEGVVDGGVTRILLQIFSKTVIGPIFFEFIQRKGDDGFGEGNFKALFESIEADQIQRGVLTEDA